MKTYGQFCGIAKALDVLGQRWTPLLLRELLLGPRRYSELQRALPGITTNLLADRTKQLAAAGLLERVRRESDGRLSWALTELGESAKPALLALGAFGSHWLGDPGADHVNGRWFMVSLQRRYEGASLDAQIGIEIDGAPYTAAVDSGGLVSRDGWPDRAQLVVRGPLQGVARALVGDGRVDSEVEVEGQDALLRRLRAGLGADHP